MAQDQSKERFIGVPLPAKEAGKSLYEKNLEILRKMVPEDSDAMSEEVKVVKAPKPL